MAMQNFGFGINYNKQRFCKEVLTWKALCHPNILPLLGVTMEDHRFTMVSEWSESGNINEFVKVHRGANQFKLVRSSTNGSMYY